MMQEYAKANFGGTKVCKAEQIREYFLNPKVENKFFGECVNYILAL